MLERFSVADASPISRSYSLPNVRSRCSDDTVRTCDTASDASMPPRSYVLRSLRESPDMARMRTKPPAVTSGSANISTTASSEQCTKPITSAVNTTEISVSIAGHTCVMLSDTAPPSADSLAVSAPTRFSGRSNQPSSCDSMAPNTVLRSVPATLEATRPSPITRIAMSRPRATAMPTNTSTHWSTERWLASLIASSGISRPNIENMICT
jgi:hypothetical protein